MQMNPNTSANTSKENNQPTLTTSPAPTLPTILLLHVSEQSISYSNALPQVKRSFTLGVSREVGIVLSTDT